MNILSNSGDGYVNDGFGYKQEEFSGDSYSQSSIKIPGKIFKKKK